uniref:Solute carrier family 17 member 4 n=1 Tax=Ailuropoda melanoleuca TaxID=9646 RepID=A0A7N5K550_AILME
MSLSIAMPAMVTGTARPGLLNATAGRPSTDSQDGWNETLQQLEAVDSSPGWSLPIKAMMKSLPLWGILVFYFTEFWIISILMAYTPIYINSVLHVNLRDSGILSSLLLAVAFISSILGGLLADFLHSRKIFRLVTIRKLSTAIGKDTDGCWGCGKLRVVFSLCVCPPAAGVLIPSVVLVSLHWVRSSISTSMGLWALSSSATTFCQIGALVNFLDIAPR